MATILMILDAEEGHIFSTLTLARHLVDRGHRVVYLSLPFALNILREEGFEFIPIFNDMLLEGAKTTGHLPTPTVFSSLVRGEALDSIVADTRPAIFITLSLWPLQALVLRYRYNTPVLLLRTHCDFTPRQETYRRGIMAMLEIVGHSAAAECLDLLRSSSSVEINNSKDIVDLALNLPEFVLFPVEFVPTSNSSDPLLYYFNIELGYRSSIKSFHWQSVDLARPIVYCALGSQAHLEPDISKRFFDVVLRAFADLADYQLILATGPGHPVLPKQYSSNVYVVEWAPQLEILALATLMITHGGPGTMKECIVNGVPMIAAPLMRDQFECSSLIERHGMGIRTDIKTITHFELKHMVARVAQNKQFEERVWKMRDYFVRSDWPKAAQVIEQLAERPTW